MSKILSILICTIPGRETLFSQLTQELTSQIEELGLVGRVEIISSHTIKNQPSIGVKRNKLKAIAQGHYICYFNDDDLPEANYLKKITQVILHYPSIDVAPDIITFNMQKFNDAVYERTYKIIMGTNNWPAEQLTFLDDNFLPLCPHKKAVAMLVNFPDQNHKSDMAYSADLKKHIGSSQHIDDVLYNYYFSEKNSAARN